ncbi:hypothetical protein NQ314_018426 [Rhamnusium bicolor]|uniref:Uncharacterized protein n=1 Tax=Rhamnusium bicolor TaxID=1586634 RepID=A0AAV8WT58_9CUCU|nr:hypothetical protein NQ314_018426 [Rhamnusium bicolor]
MLIKGESHSTSNETINNKSNLNSGDGSNRHQFSSKSDISVLSDDLFTTLKPDANNILLERNSTVDNSPSSPVIKPKKFIFKKKLTSS